MVDLHLGRRGLAELDPATGVQVSRERAGDHDATGVAAVPHCRQLCGEDIVSGVAAVVTALADVGVGPGLPELVPLVARDVGPGRDDVGAAQFGQDQLCRSAG